MEPVEANAHIQHSEEPNYSYLLSLFDDSDYPMPIPKLRGPLPQLPSPILQLRGPSSPPQLGPPFPPLRGPPFPPQLGPPFPPLRGISAPLPLPLPQLRGPLPQLPSPILQLRGPSSPLQLGPRFPPLRGPFPPQLGPPFPPLRGISAPLPLVVQGSPKTEMCKFWQNNLPCPRTVCRFAHGEHELHLVTYHKSYKSKICRNVFSERGCDYGTRCHFKHLPDK
ncbi:hypothetical protein TSUD_383040 [Trifolium subterraneum]|uniref:C3H1-type domain-containing protein n=1 Tax=Trifolium subterraneum TaxID=3900 RepID=A0A2Z6LN41_TRISU|nr:hypothetical protein TSUD_383040 [Trifolium subterraneum]